MKYYEVVIHTGREGLELITAVLAQQGITEISVKDPKDIEEILQSKETYEWDYIDEKILEKQAAETAVFVYFDATSEGREKIKILRNSIKELKDDCQKGRFGADADLGTLSIDEKLVCDEDWKDKWKEFFKPTHITEDMVVKPTWEKYEKAPGEMIIEIDPGMAFGTGTHETTASCIKLIEKYMGFQGNPKETAVLDVGCGSGILSIAAALLGSRKVLGVEIDPTAVQVAKENVKKNHVEDRVRILLGDLTRGLDFTADIVVANLTLDLIGLLIKDVKFHLKKEGVFICSGILTEQKEAAVKVIEEENFKTLEITEDGEWCAIAAMQKE